MIDFADAPLPPGRSAIFGTVFNDINGNGIQDSNEIGVPGVSIALNGAFAASANTSTDGYYVFGDLVPGFYVVRETKPDGLISTTPDTVFVVAFADLVHRVNFGDRSPDLWAFVHGSVFDDFDGDGTQELGEQGIPGVSVSVGGLSKSTDGNGAYSFAVSSEGPIIVTETDLPGHLSTTPNTVSTDVVFGGSYTVDFGDLAPHGSTICGTVFNDTNGNGAHDAVEPGIPGVVVSLSGAVASSEITGANGFFRFDRSCRRALHRKRD